MAILVFPGKGGTGKTTLAALATRYLVERGGITLAFDMDPDAHLYKRLGVSLRRTIGQIIDHVHMEKKFELEPKKPVDISDQEYFSDQVFSEVLVEGNRIDLLTLGKPNVEIDCYCPSFYWAEFAVSRIMKNYSDTYANIVVDCDPGTEIFPRKILNNISDQHQIDFVIVVLDSSLMSLDTGREIVAELQRNKLRVGRVCAVCNRVDDRESQEMMREIARSTYNLDVVGFIPTDPAIAKRSLTGEGILDLPKSSPSYQSISSILTGLG